MSAFSNARPRAVSVALATTSVLALAACNTAPSGRTQALTAGGGVFGATIGAQQGGAEGAIFGAMAGALAGAMVGMALDQIEQENLRNAQLAAARSGGSSSRSFVNSKKQRVRVESRTLSTYTRGDTRYRELSYSVSRDGGAPQMQKVTAREVKSSSGSTSWVIE